MTPDQFERHTALLKTISDQLGILIVASGLITGLLFRLAW